MTAVPVSDLGERREAKGAQRLSAPGEFSVRSRRDGAVDSICLHGEFDLAAADVVEEAIASAERGNARSIVLDLTGVTFMDSSGVRLVLGAAARSRAQSERLSLRRGRPSVQRVFEICGVDGVLPFVD